MPPFEFDMSKISSTKILQDLAEKFDMSNFLPSLPFKLPFPMQEKKANCSILQQMEKGKVTHPALRAIASSCFYLEVDCSLCSHCMRKFSDITQFGTIINADGA